MKKFDNVKYRKLLSKLHPSKYSKELVETSESDSSYSPESSEESPEESPEESESDGENVKKFRKLINPINRPEIDYFNSLDKKQQLKTLSKLSEIANADTDIPDQIKILNLDIPLEIKAIAYRKLKYLAGSSDNLKLRNWIDNFIRIPFGKFRQIPVVAKDKAKCKQFISQAMKTLNSTVYGMTEVKNQILQIIAQLISNPDSQGHAIGIQGQAGTGKTTICNGLAKILQRDFALIPLGGATDSCFLEGHPFTYEGSTYGQIIDSLIRLGSMNPIFFFDELDKISDSPKGAEITGILIHLIDQSQNSKFHDRYFSEIEFDLSKALFIFSYNDESAIDPILRDRMYKLSIHGYSVADKLIISRDFIIPSVSDQFKIKLSVPDETIEYIIQNYSPDAGVRSLKRSFEIIYGKINLNTMMTGSRESNVSRDLAQKLLPSSENESWKTMYL